MLLKRIRGKKLLLSKSQTSPNEEIGIKEGPSFEKIKRRPKFKSRSEDGGRERKPNFKKSQKQAPKSKGQNTPSKKQSQTKSDGQHFTIRKKGN